MQFTRFPSKGVMLKSKNYEIVTKTLLEIVGTDDLEWETWNKIDGKYTKSESN